ncbi:hypothetical protein J0676_28075, partial [Vibrio sp. Vb2880]|uniref:hypothetical protein n=1 Tax=Vibrio sp. Vb2880 TaxID=2816076 RepID=UPI001A8FE88A
LSFHGPIALKIESSTCHRIKSRQNQLVLAAFYFLLHTRLLLEIRCGFYCFVEVQHSLFEVRLKPYKTLSRNIN